jgi:hypothetical protein
VCTNVPITFLRCQYNLSYSCIRYNSWHASVLDLTQIGLHDREVSARFSKALSAGYVDLSCANTVKHRSTLKPVLLLRQNSAATSCTSSIECLSHGSHEVFTIHLYNYDIYVIELVTIADPTTCIPIPRSQEQLSIVPRQSWPLDVSESVRPALSRMRWLKRVAVNI